MGVGSRNASSGDHDRYHCKGRDWSGRPADSHARPLRAGRCCRLDHRRFLGIAALQSPATTLFRLSIALGVLSANGNRTLA